MLHSLHQPSGFWTTQETFDVTKACSKADPAHPHASPKALRALSEFVSVLGTFAAQSAPFARATTHVTSNDTRPRTLPTAVGRVSSIVCGDSLTLVGCGSQRGCSGEQNKLPTRSYQRYRLEGLSLLLKRFVPVRIIISSSLSYNASAAWLPLLR